MTAADCPDVLLLLGGRWERGGSTMAVEDKFTGQPIGTLHAATAEQVGQAVTIASLAVQDPLPAGDRERVLRRVADVLESRKDDLRSVYIAETGFTARDAATEADRAIEIYRLCAGEATRIAGEEIPLAGAPGNEHRVAFTIRVPVGIVAAISPFNAPLSTVAHKLGPAIAAGNAVVLKPSELTPRCANVVAQAFLEAGLPPGLLQVIHGRGGEAGDALIRDPRVRFITFTGSTDTGLKIKQRSGLSRSQLELGSNSVSIVAADADLGAVAKLVARAGFRKAGQVCTSVQRLLVEEPAAAELTDAVVAEVEKLTAGDPRDPGTDVGPLISLSSARRASSWISEAQSGGAHVLTGGVLARSVLTPAVVVDAPAGSQLMTREAFAPVVTIAAVPSVRQAIDTVNAGRYGLQTGIFTRDIDLAFLAARQLHVGGVMINDTSSFHADAMPYGGVKDSGYGVSGPRYAVADMTDQRVIVLNLADPDRG